MEPIENNEINSKIESNKEMLTRHLKAHMESNDYAGIPYLNAMDEWSNQQNATLIAEHRLMKEALEDISNGSNSFEACIASETLKNITL